MKRQIYCSILVGLLSVFGIAQARAADEIEPNDTVDTAQRVDIPDGSITVSGVIGNGSAANDVDFYSFYGQEGDVVTVDIDGGWGGAQNVDTVVAIFATTDGFPMLRMNDDAPDLDPGSTSTSDARIDDFRLPATGFYVVGVSSYPHYFSDGGVVSNPTLVSNGDYALVISGVSPAQVAAMQVNIEVKPHSRERVRIDPKSRHKIPVALLSSSEFDAPNVDKSSLTFGATGDEPSFSRCLYPFDVNHDGLVDMICLFKNDVAGFEPGDLEGILRGRTDDGREFEGHGLLKVMPEKHRFGHRHRHSHRWHHESRRHEDHDD